MSELTNMIEEVVRDFNLQLQRCMPVESHEIVEKARAVFVVDDPRVWWLDLRWKPTRCPSENASIDSVVPAGCRTAWFIVEDGTRGLPVYEATPGDVEVIRKNGPAFEYYYVDKDFRWMIVETDHDEFMVCELPPGVNPSSPSAE